MTCDIFNSNKTCQSKKSEQIFTKFFYILLLYGKLFPVIVAHENNKSKKNKLIPSLFKRKLPALVFSVPNSLQGHRLFPVCFLETFWVRTQGH